jgi:hypothetical protein
MSIVQGIALETSRICFDCGIDAMVAELDLKTDGWRASCGSLRTSKRRSVVSAARRGLSEGYLVEW